MGGLIINSKTSMGGEKLKDPEMVPSEEVLAEFFRQSAKMTVRAAINTFFLMLVTISARMGNRRVKVFRRRMNRQEAQEESYIG